MNFEFATATRIVFGREAAAGIGAEAAVRFEEAARILTANSRAGADEGIAWLKSLCERLNVPRLST